LIHFDPHDANTAFVIGASFGAFLVLSMEAIAVMGGMTAIRILKIISKSEDKGKVS
jgi:hypothetical protein